MGPNFSVNTLASLQPHKCITTDSGLLGQLLRTVETMLYIYVYFLIIPLFLIWEKLMLTDSLCILCYVSLGKKQISIDGLNG